MFVKYSKITNSYSEKFVNRILEDERTMHEVWFATEKIHGCLRNDTLITTREFGEVPIEFLVKNKIKCNILSFNHEDKEVEWDEIIDFSKTDNKKDWYEVELDDGIIFVITGNHEVWVDSEKKYIPIEEIKKLNEVFLLRK